MQKLFCLMLALPASFVGEDAEDSIVAPGQRPVLLVKEGAGEGPAWHPELGLLFSGEKGIGRFSRDGKFPLYREAAGTNGLLFDHKGRLLACEPVRRRVTRQEPDGTLTVLTERYNGKRYNQPNDLTIDSKGRIYFTDPCYGDRSKMEMTDGQGQKVEGVYRIDPEGRVTRVLGRDAVNRPNGIRVSNDERYLYVADNNNDTVGGARKLWRFDVRPDGSVDAKSRKLLFDWETSRGPDGIKLDVKGRLYVASGLHKANPPHETNRRRGGVYVFSPDGDLLRFIHIEPDEVTNCAFGGDDLRTLYITAGGSLWSVRMTTPGHVPWPPRPGGTP